MSPFTPVPDESYAIRHPAAVLASLRTILGQQSEVHLVTTRELRLKAVMGLMSGEEGLWVKTAEGLNPRLAAVAQRFEVQDRGVTVHVPAENLEFIDKGQWKLAMPEVIWRFQRRASYRLQHSQAPTLMLEMQIPVPDWPTEALILDLSAGGLSFWLTHPRHPEADEVIRRGKIDLDESGVLVSDLVVRHRAMFKMNGQSGWRVGCAFQYMAETMQRRLQSWLLEKERLHLNRLRRQSHLKV